MDLEIDHLNGLHESEPHTECQICQRDATISYQAQMLEQVEETQVRILKDLDILLKSVKSFHMNVANNDSLIPFGDSTKWVLLETTDLRPHQCEKVEILIGIDVQTNQHFRTIGYFYRDKWYGWESREVVSDVVAWRKLFGQLEIKKISSQKLDHIP